LNENPGAQEGQRKTPGFSLNLDVLWICLAVSVILDVIGLYKGLGFDPSFQLEMQPLFFAGIVATIYLVVTWPKLGSLVAGTIFWIPIIFLLIDLLLLGHIVPFGGDVVGLGELITAIVGVVAAHNTYHKSKT